MRWRQLQAFRETMIAGTVSGAAEILGISQPAVSRLIEGLEASLSLSLFDRRTGRLIPTAEAQLFYDEVVKAFVSYDQLRSFATDIRHGRRGTLSIACQPAIGLSFLPEVIAEYKRYNPDVAISLDLQSSPRVEALVASQQIDLGFADFTVERYGIERETFLKEPYVVAMPKEHPLADRPAIVPDDLAEIPLIAFTTDIVVRRLLETAAREAHTELNITCEVTVAAAVLRMVQHRLGLGIIDPVTARDFASEDIVIRSFFPSLSYHVALLYPRHTNLTRAASEFLRLSRRKRKDLSDDIRSLVAPNGSFAQKG